MQRNGSFYIYPSVSNIQPVTGKVSQMYRTSRLYYSVLTRSKTHIPLSSRWKLAFVVSTSCMVHTQSLLASFFVCLSLYFRISSVIQPRKSAHLQEVVSLFKT
ncbi:hypothetical protein RND81_01G014100 [Saponaria officinalis]|uniref:Uncharacterized protein n=1 Tax=Saponaria officinalis TaxID=3572 RepID=A0AAW1N848_SAPOF